MRKYANDAGEPLMTAAQARLEADLDAQTAAEDAAGLNDDPGRFEPVATCSVCVEPYERGVECDGCGEPVCAACYRSDGVRDLCPDCAGVVDPLLACPRCEEDRVDSLCWQDDDDPKVRCVTCGLLYKPNDRWWGHRSWEQCVERWPRLTAACQWAAILSIGEAGTALREYLDIRDGRYRGRLAYEEAGSEAVVHFGGCKRVIERAVQTRNMRRRRGTTNRG